MRAGGTRLRSGAATGDPLTGPTNEGFRPRPRRCLVLVDGSPYLHEIAHTIARSIGTFVNRGRFGSFERG